MKNIIKNAPLTAGKKQRYRFIPILLLLVSLLFLPYAVTWLRADHNDVPPKQPQVYNLSEVDVAISEADSLAEWVETWDPDQRDRFVFLVCDFDDTCAAMKKKLARRRVPRFTNMYSANFVYSPAFLSNKLKKTDAYKMVILTSRPPFGVQQIRENKGHTKYNRHS